MVAISLLVWAGLAGVTHVALTRYAFTPGPKAEPSVSWPYASGIARIEGRSALVAFLHPRCPCSRATMTALEELARFHGASLDFSIVFISDPDAGLTIDPRTEPLWLRAAALDGVALYVDPGAVIARRFGALTSGQVFVFGPDDTLAFEGGLTSARGHGGESAGTVAIAAVLRGDVPETRSAPVFGCGLVDPEASKVVPP